MPAAGRRWRALHKVRFRSGRRTLWRPSGSFLAACYTARQRAPLSALFGGWALCAGPASAPPRLETRRPAARQQPPLNCHCAARAVVRGPLEADQQTIPPAAAVPPAPHLRAVQLDSEQLLHVLGTEREA